MATATAAIEFDTQQVNVNWTQGYLPVFTFCKSAAAVTTFTAKILKKTKPLYALSVTNMLLNSVAIVWSVVDGIANDDSGVSEEVGAEGWAIIAGNDIGRGTIYLKWGYSTAYGTNETWQDGLETLPYFTLGILGMNLAGFGGAAVATGFKKLSATPPPSACPRSSPWLVRQLMDQVAVLWIRLPKKAECKQRSRLIAHLERARRAYARSDTGTGDAALRRFAHTLQGMKNGRRVAAADADLLLMQVQDLLACQV
jgi:hypothetical protein